MKLQDRLPQTVTVGKKRYRLDLDFRNVLRMMDFLGRDDMLPSAREWRALRCVMRHPPRNASPVMEAVRALLFPETKRAADQKKITDFEQDADLIRAAFRQVYGINLYTDRLHWLEFSSLLACLPDGNRYSEVLGIRARPMPKAEKWNAEERRWLMKAKAECALKMSEKERARNYEKSVHNIFSGLMAWAQRGGDDHGGRAGGI